MQFIQLDTWAFLTRPLSMTVHGRASFMLFIERYLRDAPGQGYSYAPSDVYAARSFASHIRRRRRHSRQGQVGRDMAVSSGEAEHLRPCLDWMAYVSVMRFILDARAAVSACIAEGKADKDNQPTRWERCRASTSWLECCRAEIRMRWQLWSRELMREHDAEFARDEALMQKQLDRAIGSLVEAIAFSGCAAVR